MIDQFNHLKRNLDFRFRALPDKKSQILLERIRAHTQLLDKVEEQLLTGAEDFSEVKARFEAEAWQQLDPTDDPELDSLLQGRASDVLSTNDALEYQKCAKDPIHFMKKYCYIQHPVRGKIPFHLFQFQERTLLQSYR